MKTRSRIIEQAQSWIGCMESDGSHKQIIDLYNSHKPLAENYTVRYTDSWCAAFVSACSIACGYTDIIPTECGVMRMIELYRKMGRWVGKNDYVPFPGDLVFYNWEGYLPESECGGHYNHVGIVETVNGSAITVIEGNKSHSVSRRSVSVGEGFIRGFGVPAYDDVMDCIPGI